MLDIGFPELFIVAVLAIIVVGPKDLPKVIRSVMKMVRKVREMGGEFQAGVKKMADEVELDEVTRKLNEAGNISLDDVGKKKKPAVDPKAEFSDYEEFDYDQYDYEGNVSDQPAKPDIKEPDIKEEDKPETSENEEPKAEDPVAEVQVEKAEKPEAEPAATEEVPEPEVKSKSDD